MADIPKIDIVAIFEKAAGHRVPPTKPYVSGRSPIRKPKTKVTQHAKRTSPRTAPNLE